MKVIQSFWSKPSNNKSEDPNSRYKGGWLHQKHAFYSQALSCLTFKQFYDQVELYTDADGRHLLIDILDIPYTNVHITLDQIDKYNSKLWALGKIFTYAEQNEPFIHCDSDVFIWKKLPELLTTSPLFAQNAEINFPAYEEALNDVFINFDWIPTELINSLYKNKGIHALNAGIIGGQETHFFKKLKEQVLEFIEKNDHLLDKIDIGIFNTIFEQQLAFAIAEKNNIPVSYYLENVDSDFSKVINFHTVPFQSQYVHCIGYAKKSFFACEQVEARLKYHFPEFYDKLNNRLAKYFDENSFQSDITPERMDFLFNLYDWVSNKSVDDISNTTFKLNPSCKIIEENDSYFLEHIVPQTKNFQRQELKDWNVILLYFEEPTTINQLYEDLSEDENFLKNTNKETLKEKLISFVMDKTMLLEILQPISTY